MLLSSKLSTSDFRFLSILHSFQFSIFGKHKLLERISPNKTIEGFIGGMTFAFIASYLIALNFTVLSTVQWLVIAGIVSIFGVLGDLITSDFT